MAKTFLISLYCADNRPVPPSSAGFTDTLDAAKARANAMIRQEMFDLAHPWTGWTEHFGSWNRDNGLIGYQIDEAGSE